MRCGVILWTALLASSCPQWTRAFSLAGGGRLSNERQTFRALGATISNKNNDSDVYIPNMADEAVAFARKWGIPSTVRSTTHDNHQHEEYIPSMADEAVVLARKWGLVLDGNDDHDETSRHKDQRVIPPSPIEANGNILVKEIAEVDTIVANRQEDRPPFAVASRANHIDDTSDKEQAEQGPHVLALADTSMASMAFPDDDGDDHHDDDDDDADNDDNASVEENEFEPPRVLTVADMIAAAAARDADSNNSSNPQDDVDVEETNQQLRTMYKEFLDQRDAYGAAATADKPLFRVPPVKRAVRKQQQSTSILNNPTPVQIMAQGKRRRFDDAVIPDDRIKSQPAPVFSRSDHTTSNYIVHMVDQATAFARKWGIVEQ